VSRENVEVVLRRFEAQRDGRPPPDDLHPDIVLVTDWRWPEAGEYQGIEEVNRFLRRYYDDWRRTSFDWDEPMVVADRVLVRFRMGVTGRSSGVDVVNEASGVYTIRDGRIARIEYFLDHAEALEAAGLSA
jgi:ketosteroid isomerase-like protein